MARLGLSYFLTKIAAVALIVALGLFSVQAHSQPWVPEDKLQRLCETWHEGLGMGSSPNFFGTVLGDLIQPDLLDFAKLGWIVMNPTNSGTQKAWKDLANHYWKTPRFYRVIHLVSDGSKERIFSKCFGRLSPMRRAEAATAFMGTLQAYAYSVSGVATVALIAAGSYMIAKLGVVRAGFMQLTILRWLVSRVYSYMVPLLTVAIARAATDPTGAPYVFRVLQHLHRMAGWKQFVALMTPIFAFVPSAMAGHKHEWMEDGGRGLVKMAEGAKDIWFAVDEAMTPTDLDAEFESYLLDKVGKKERLSWREAGVVLAATGSKDDSSIFSDLDREFAFRQKVLIVDQKIEALQCLDEEEYRFALEKMGYKTPEGLQKKYETVSKMHRDVRSLIERVQADRRNEVMDPVAIMHKVRANPNDLSESEKRFLKRVAPLTHFSSQDRILVQMAIAKPMTQERLAAIRVKIAKRNAAGSEEIRAIGKNIPRESWTENERVLIEKLILSRIPREVSL